jgi:hypothetical protein
MVAMPVFFRSKIIAAVIPRSLFFTGIFHNVTVSLASLLLPVITLISSCRYYFSAIYAICCATAIAHISPAFSLRMARSRQRGAAGFTEKVILLVCEDAFIFIFSYYFALPLFIIAILPLHHAYLRWRT